MGLLLGMVGGEPKGCWRWLVVNRRGVCGGGRCMGMLLVVNRRGVLMWWWVNRWGAGVLLEMVGGGWVGG